MAELSDEQIAELQQKAAKAEELEKFKNDSAAKLAEYETARSEWEKKEKEYQDQVNPNWQKARTSMNAMREALKSKGIQVDEDGNPVDTSKIQLDQVKREAEAAAEKKLIDVRLEEFLEEYDNDSAEVIRHFYRKLTTGEEVTLRNVKTFLSQAENVAKGGDKKLRKISTALNTGQGPRQAENKVDSEKVDTLANAMGIKIN